MHAVIYTRISKDREGAGLGVERQRSDCEELAKRLGWTVVETFSDNDISAYSGRKRPGYDEMCEALKSGRAKGVVAWHADRLHRRPVELESFIDLCDSQQIDVRTVQSGTVDLSNASGRMVARMLGASARHEVEHNVERQKSAKKQAAMDGKFRGGRRPFGYEPDGMTARPDEANAIRNAAEDLLSGVSLRQITRNWNAAGLRTSFGDNEFTSRDVRKILLRPRNAGIALHEGKRLDTGAWEKIIDRDTFDAIEGVLRDPSRQVAVSMERKYQGTGIYICGKCGAPMRAAAHNRGPDGWRRTYTCSQTKHLARDLEYLDAYVDEIVIGVLSRPNAKIRLGGPVVDIAALRAKRDRVREKLDDLVLKFSRDEIDGEQLSIGTADLRAQEQEIKAQLAAARSASALTNLILAGDDLRQAWADAPPDVRGKIIDRLMTVTVKPGARGRKPGGGYFDPDSVRVDPKNVTE
jgi:DNA invertase Pin-like site-specific DNA recombinase